MSLDFHPTKAVREAGDDAVPRLVDLLLEEQRSLSAVDTFARRHDAGTLPDHVSAYQELIPVGRTPGEGQQLAFRVDLDVCTGCKACVTACHNLNGLAEDETWRAVGLLVGEDRVSAAPVQQTVTTACHHCEDPACLGGCPVKAYEKDPVSGIVRHLDDQCIGCQYCLLKCPYEVPQYQPELGIVRKCDMCTDRLAVDEAPACVQGCPNSAISIQIVEVGGAPAPLLPGVNGAIPDSAYTRPTTRYVSERPLAALRPADAQQLRPAAAHDPLAVMLVLMQLSWGVLCFDALSGLFSAASPGAHLARLALACGTALLGLGAATFHLGRPLYAFRAFLGWRTSWMSREIITVGGYVGALVATLASAVLGIALPEIVLPGVGVPVIALHPWIQAAAIAMGALGTLSSIMIYVDTRRASWGMARTTLTFVGTALCLGALGAAVASVAAALLSGDAGGLPGAAGLLAFATLTGASKLYWERRTLRVEEGPLARSAQLLREALAGRTRARLLATSLGLPLAGIAVAASFAGIAPLALGASGLALLACFCGELLERHLFFVAEVSPAMPGR